MMVKTDPNTASGRRYESGAPPDPDLIAAVGKHAEEARKAGLLLNTGGLMPSSHGARVRASGGRLIVTDGPFIESKELIGGFATIEAGSKEEAIEMGKAFMKIHLDVLGPAYEGELEIRQMFDEVSRGAEAEQR
jgi:hypothetical protein